MRARFAESSTGKTTTKVPVPFVVVRKTATALEAISKRQRTARPAAHGELL